MKTHSSMKVASSGDDVSRFLVLDGVGRGRDSLVLPRERGKEVPSRTSLARRDKIY